MKLFSTTLLLFLFNLQSSAQLFTKVTEGTIVNTLSDSRSVNIIDLNGDDWEDVFISNGLNGGQNDLLYLNNGDGTFSESSSDITADGKSSVGATFADYDNDGDVDAYVTNWYGQINGLFKNDGTSFLELQNDQAISQPSTFAETASWGDYNNDGLLDLYVTNSGGDKKNLLYQNNGQGILEQTDNEVLTTEADLSRNVDWFDIDDDGDQDLLISNEDNTENDLYLNDGSGHFSKVTGIPLVTEASSTQSFSYGDIDNDGDLDLFFANAGFYQEQNNQLFRNENGSFVLDNNSITSTDGGCSFSSAFVDYDNDADLDLFVSNGFCGSNLQNFLYENQGDGTFVKSEEELPELAAVCSYGAAWGDLNNDGFQDLVIANCKNSSTATQQNNDLYINNGNDNSWLKVKLIGTVSNRSAIGATIRLTAYVNGQFVTQRKTISAQSGYAAQNSLIAHFGLGDAAFISFIQIDWPSGITTFQKDLAANQMLTIEEEMTNKVSSLMRQGFEINLNPNPVSDKIQLSITSEQELPSTLNLKIIDSLGRVVKTETVKTSTANDISTLNISSLGAGHYLLNLYADGILKGQQRFVKK